MSTLTAPAGPPEHNVTGLDFADRRHLRYSGPPLIDVHAHIMRTRSAEEPRGEGPAVSLEQAEIMLDVAAEFGVGRVYSMCPPEDIPPLRARFGDRIGFNGSIGKKAADEPDDEAYRLLDRFLEQGVALLKFWSAPRGRERGLFVDAPFRIEAARRARAAGVRVIMVHVADPDAWFHSAYADTAKYGTKADQYRGLERLLTEFPDIRWIAAHMGGDPEHPEHLERLLESYSNLSFDTSATKWQVREVSARRDVVRGLICRHPQRFLFGSDVVARPGMPRAHHVSRYWCQRTLWESAWEGRSPIADADYVPATDQPPTPPLQGLELPMDVLELLYHQNARRLLSTDRGPVISARP